MLLLMLMHLVNCWTGYILDLIEADEAFSRCMQDTTDLGALVECYGVLGMELVQAVHGFYACASV